MVAFEREIVEEYTARAFDQARDDFSYDGGNWPLGTSSLSNPGTLFRPHAIRDTDCRSAMR